MIGIVVGSFFYYAPCFFSGFDSDHAIHVLMAYDFSLPHDFYYWGQNRLGSLLPLVASVFIKLFSNIHPLYVVSVIQYFFILIPSIIVSTFISNRWLKIAFFTFVFFPFNEYYILLLPGHPYSGQYLSAVICVYCLYRFKKSADSFDLQIDLRRASLLLLAQIFYALGVWVSEFSALVILIPFIYLLIENNFKKIYFPVISAFLFVILPLIAVLTIKSFFPADATYDKAVFFNATDISRQFFNLWTRIKDTLFFADGLVLRNLNYYLLLILAIVTVFLRNKYSGKASEITKSIILAALISFVLLFFSTWNLRSDIAAKYYIPIYLMILVGWLFYLDSFGSARFSIVVSLIFVLISFGSLFESKYVVKEYPGGAMKNFSEFKNLQKGTLIGHYWDVYLINAVAIKNLKAISYEDEIGRNHDRSAELMKAKRVYFLNNEEFRKRCKNDTIKQFGHMLTFSGRKIICNDQEVLVFHKVMR